MIISTRAWAVQAFRALGVKISRITQEGDTIVVEYCTSVGKGVMEITPHQNPALTMEYIRKKLGR